MERLQALLHSLATTQGLVDGNKHAALLATKAMLDINGWTFDVEDDWSLYHFVMDVAEGRINDVAKIAEALLAMSKPIEFPPDLL